MAQLSSDRLFTDLEIFIGKDMKKLTIPIFITLMLVSTAVCYGIDSENGTGVWDESASLRSVVKQLVYEKKFKELEKLVHDARTRKLRFKNSYWVLQDLYNGIPYMMITFEAVYEFVDEWRKGSPDSHIPDVIEARAFIARAWQVRGSGWSKEVTDNEYRGFKAYLVKARKSISIAEKKESADPQICTVKTTLAFLLAGNKKLARKYFNDCVSIEPGYYPVYFEMINYLQPKWYGSSEEMLKFVEESANGTRYLYNDGMYALLVNARSDNSYELFDDKNGEFSWQRTKSGFRDILAKYGKSSYILHRYGFLAMLANDHKALAEVLKETGTAWDKDKDKYYKKRSWYDYHLHKAKDYM